MFACDAQGYKKGKQGHTESCREVGMLALTSATL